MNGEVSSSSFDGDTARGPRRAQRRRDDGKSMLKQTRVLYVEDDAAVREQLAQFLRRRVRELIVAEDGLAGLESFRSQRPDMVVTDVRMSRLDGLSMVRQMKAQDQAMPIVVTSAFGDAQYLMQAIELGVERYVLKPLDIDRLLDALEFCSRLAHAERGLRLSQAIIESASEAVVVLDAAGAITSANPAFQTLTGYHGAQIQGQDIGLVVSEADVETMRQNHDGAPRRWRGEIPMRRADGSSFHAMCSVDPVVGSDGSVLHRVLMFYDVTDARNAREQMQHLAYYDPLTGLANRRLFDEQLHNSLDYARAQAQQIGLLFVDLDRFKEVNDAYGHAMGDLLLREVGQRLCNAVREQDLVSRRSGDEFVLLLRHVGSRDEAHSVAQRVQTAVEAPLQIEAIPISITCSIGIAVYPDDGTEARALLRHADGVMYEVKKDRRNRSPSG
jgi:diguanylate cyclase (GGDEF)-like protein/PAS domain S-box-containing protein